MSDPVIKRERKTSARSAPLHNSRAATTATSRKGAKEVDRTQVLAKRSSTNKIPVRKADKPAAKVVTKTTAPRVRPPARQKGLTKTVPSSTQQLPARKSPSSIAPPKAFAKTATKSPQQQKLSSAKASAKPQRKAETVTKTAVASPKAAPKKVSKAAPAFASKTIAKDSSKRQTALQVSPAKGTKPALKSRAHKTATADSFAPNAQPVTVVHQPTRDESAALHAFEVARKEFARGRFAEAGALFRQIVEAYPGVTEITARARTYFSVAQARLQAENALPKDADALYDRGVVELNRGNYVAAQEMFERALRSNTGDAYIYYGLAATRARLGSIAAALAALEQALNLQPNLRARAQYDGDFATLRGESDFERIVSRS